MSNPRDEFTSLAHRVRYYKRQSMASGIAFVIAVALVAVFVGQALDAKAKLAEVEYLYQEQLEIAEQLSSENESMNHYILTLQGRLNACRMESGLAEINWEKYQ